MNQTCYLLISTQEFLINIVLKYPNDYPWKPPQINVNGHITLDYYKYRTMET